MLRSLLSFEIVGRDGRIFAERDDVALSFLRMSRVSTTKREELVRKTHAKVKRLLLLELNETRRKELEVVPAAGRAVSGSQPAHKK